MDFFVRDAAPDTAVAEDAGRATPRVGGAAVSGRSLPIWSTADVRTEGAGPASGDRENGQARPDRVVAAASGLEPGGGRPLDAATRATMEAALGWDLGAVRVHTDADAVGRAAAAGARGFTAGRDIVLGGGPGVLSTAEGRQTLRHEVVHAVQQAQPGGGSPAAQETEARVLAERADLGGARHAAEGRPGGSSRRVAAPDRARAVQFEDGTPPTMPEFSPAQRDAMARLLDRLSASGLTWNAAGFADGDALVRFLSSRPLDQALTELSGRVDAAIHRTQVRQRPGGRAASPPEGNLVEPGGGGGRTVPGRAPAAAGPAAAPSGQSRITATGRAPDGVFVDMEIGPAVGRLGLERTLPSGTEVGLAGWQRAHAGPPGLGAETDVGIRYAPPELNLRYQNAGVEQFIRNFNAARAPGVQLFLRTVVATHPRSLRVASVTYRLSASRDGQRPVDLFEVDITVANQSVDPKVQVGKPRVGWDWTQFVGPPGGRAPGGTSSGPATRSRAASGSPNTATTAQPTGERTPTAEPAPVTGPVVPSARSRGATAARVPSVDAGDVAREVVRRDRQNARLARAAGVLRAAIAVRGLLDTLDSIARSLKIAAEVAAHGTLLHDEVAWAEGKAAGAKEIEDHYVGQDYRGIVPGPGWPQWDGWSDLREVQFDFLSAESSLQQTLDAVDELHRELARKLADLDHRLIDYEKGLILAQSSAPYMELILFMDAARQIHDRLVDAALSCVHARAAIELDRGYLRVSLRRVEIRLRELGVSGVFGDIPTGELARAELSRFTAHR